MARLALALAPHAECIWVAAGPGNNGGDGLDAAMHLRAAGKHVQVTLQADASRLPDDARDALARAQAAGVHIGLDPAPALGQKDIAIDALLGVGADRAPSDALAVRVAELNRLRCSVLAVDVPSGLHSSTGQALGDACVRARHTAALLTLFATGDEELIPGYSAFPPHALYAWYVFTASTTTTAPRAESDRTVIGTYLSMPLVAVSNNK